MRVRTIYNRVLGGWFNVTGPHQTPLGGRYDTREQAMAALHKPDAPNVRRIYEQRKGQK